jgi:hypothetical protein
MEGSDLSFRTIRQSQDLSSTVPSQSILLSNPKVRSQMITYLHRGCDDKTTPEEMILYVNHGEEIAKQLAAGKSPSEIGISKANARDLVWYMFAMTASYDELFVKGVIRMDDSDKRLYQFLDSCHDDRGGAYERVSSHLHSAMEPGKMQKGLDMGDYKMPGNLRHILFSDLKDGTTFVKLEPYGLPPFWSKGFRSLANFKEFINHSLQYISTRFVKKSKNYTARREHLTSEQKKKFSTVMNHFKELAVSRQDKDWVKGLKKEGLKQGLSRMEENLTVAHKEFYQAEVMTLSPQQTKKFMIVNSILFSLQDELKEIREQDLRKSYTKGRQGSEATLPSFAEFFRQLNQVDKG